MTSRRGLVVAITICLAAACRQPQLHKDVAIHGGDYVPWRYDSDPCATTFWPPSAPACLAALKAAGEAESKRALRFTPPRSRVQNPGSL